MNANIKIQNGFTLIELMIVVAIIGILAAIALPAYQDFTVRSKVSEGLVGAASLKTTIAEGYNSDGVPGIDAAVSAWTGAADCHGSKYVSCITGTTNTGEITVTFTALTGLAGGETINLLPTINVAGTPTAPGAGVIGPMDWGCASDAAVKATSVLHAPPTPGTLPAKYAPSECR